MAKSVAQTPVRPVGSGWGGMIGYGDAGEDTRVAWREQT